jgi:release factor glutamine methyltransferase
MFSGGEKQMSSYTIQSLLRQTIDIFREAGIENARGEAEILFSEKLNIPRLELYVSPDVKISPGAQRKLCEFIERRTLREPLQYILGRAHFMDLSLEVGPGVLIPRPETELLAEYVIKHAPPDAEVCDIGTGSGAIALAVAFERPDVMVTGVELSGEAIKYARKNLRRYKLNNAKIIHGDLFSRLKGKRFDVITANLPYVTEEEYCCLDDEVRCHEPISALVGGYDGLDVVRRLVAQSPEHLKEEAFMILELGVDHGDEVCAICRATKYFSDVKILKDLTGRNRFVVAR